MLNRPQIKAEARGLIRTAVVSPILVTAIVQLVTFLLDRVSDLVESGSLFYGYTFSRDYLDALLSGGPDALAGLMLSSPQSTAATMFFTILVGLFTIVLQGGYYVYCMGIRQRRQMPYSTLLDGLSVSGKLIWCNILIYIKTWLWAMLFVIPGLIATYRYRFAYYNILTDPSLSASEAIRLSCRQTRGMKLNLCMLDLSFLGGRCWPPCLPCWWDWGTA